MAFYVVGCLERMELSGACLTRRCSDMAWQLCGVVVVVVCSTSPQRSGRSVIGQPVSTPAGDVDDDGLNVWKDTGVVASVDDGGGVALRTRSDVVMHGGDPAEHLHCCHVVDVAGGGGGGRSESGHTE